MALLFKSTSICTELVAVWLVVLSAIYLFFVYAFSYWRRRGVKTISPSFPFGNFAPVFLLKQWVGEVGCDLYNRTTEPFIGIYAICRPILFVRDIDLIQHIIVKDFNHFVDRGVYHDVENDPMTANLFTLTGTPWRNMRKKLTPTLTPAKVKEMFPTIKICSDALQRVLSEQAQKNEPFELRDIAARFTSDVIASIAFGVEVNSLKNPNEPFRVMGQKIFHPKIKTGLRWMSILLFPKVVKFFNLRFVDREVEEFMVNLVTKTIKYREKNNILRKDYIQLLIHLYQTGFVQRDDEWKVVDSNSKEKSKAITLSEIAANALGFYGGGFESSSGTTTFCLFELARNPDVQRKAHDEIDEVLAKHNGCITYEAIAEMTYLEKCFDETLRKYPTLPVLPRECTTAYKIPNTDVILEKGTFILVPIMGIQRDEKYSPEPMKFIPDRFNDKDALRPMTYLPFGDGPRTCFGMRLAKVQTKVALVTMLRDYRYELADVKYYTEELPISASNIAITSKCGINLRMCPRNE